MRHGRLGDARGSCDSTYVGECRLVLGGVNQTEEPLSRSHEVTDAAAASSVDTATEDASDAAAAPPLSFNECQDLGSQAATLVGEEMSDVHICEAASDCKGWEAPKHCWATCSYLLIGSAAYRAAMVKALEGEAGDLCAEFEASGCSVAPASCPITGQELAITGWACVNNECAAQYAE